MKVRLVLCFVLAALTALPAMAGNTCPLNIDVRTGQVILFAETMTDAPYAAFATLEASNSGLLNAFVLNTRDQWKADGVLDLAKTNREFAQSALCAAFWADFAPAVKAVSAQLSANLVAEIVKNPMTQQERVVVDAKLLPRYYVPGASPESYSNYATQCGRCGAGDKSGVYCRAGTCPTGCPSRGSNCSVSFAALID